MPAFPAKCAWGGAKGKPEDAEMRSARRVIQVCLVGKAGI